MKNNKLHILFGLYFLALMPMQAQQFYADDLTAFSYTVPNGPTGSYIPFWFKEQIKLDSNATNGEFYTVTLENIDPILKVQKDTVFAAPLNSSYQLRVKEDKVYFTGFLRFITFNGVAMAKDSMHLEDFLLYDFTLQKGDSIPNHAGDNWIKLDSVKNITYLNGKQRETFYLSETLKQYSKKYIWIKNLGSNVGLNYLPSSYIEGVALETQMLSYCENNRVVAVSARFDKPGFTDYCTDSEINKLVEGSRKGSSVAGFVQPLAIYPNPTSGKIWLDDIYIGEYEVKDLLGKTIQSGNFENTIDISDFKPGVYQLYVKAENKYFVSKVIKLER